MAIATTSVGQEGLDFHLYCRDIYHWNLPSSPVAFEQREGRINRYNSIAIRRRVVAKHGSASAEGNSFIWKSIFEAAEAETKSSKNSYGGLSPHWIYEGTANENERPFSRHVLDIPGTGDKSRYETLMRNLDLYRLALGQPNQQQFIDKLKENPIIREDPKTFILNFSPGISGKAPAQMKDSRASLTVRAWRAPVDLPNLVPPSLPGKRAERR